MDAVAVGHCHIGLVMVRMARQPSPWLHSNIIHSISAFQLTRVRCIPSMNTCMAVCMEIRTAVMLSILSAIWCWHIIFRTFKNYAPSKYLLELTQ